MDDLSIPFMELSGGAIENITENVTENISEMAGGFSDIFSKYGVFILGAAIILIIIYTFKNSKSSENANVVVPSPQLEQENQIDVLQIAQKYYHNFKKNIGNKKRNYVQCVTNFEKAFQREPNPYIALTLAKLYHEGLSDTYDADGNKVNGIPPNAPKAIEYYIIAIRNGNTRSILDMAAIYHWGLPGFYPNREYAKALYALLLKIGNSYDKGIAKDKLLQLCEEDGKTVGTNGTIVNGAVYSAFSNNLIGESPFSENFMSFATQGDPNNIGKDELTQGVDEKYLQELMDDLNQSDPRFRNLNAEKENIIKNNPHNARDHIVTNTAKASIEKLKSTVHVQWDVASVLTQLQNYIENNVPNSTKKQDALRVVAGMAKNRHSPNYEDTRELDALTLVWNRIFSHTNKKNRKTLCDNLVNELAECIEYGELVCPSGRVNRILDTLNFVDKDVKIIPKWALEQEMLTKAAKIRKRMLDRAQGKVKDALNSPRPTVQQQQDIKNFMTRFRKELEDTFKRDYVESGIMDQNLLNTEMGKWIDYI